MNFYRFLYLSFLITMTLGCRQEPVVTYRVPKSSPVESPVATAPAPSSGHREITWQTPAGWEEQPASNMRVGSFIIRAKDGRQADLSVIPLAGQAGGDLSNINRWRGQINLPPLLESELAAHSQTIQVGGRTMRLIDMVSETNLKDNQKVRILAAIYPQKGKSWFFKMTGEDALVKSAKPDFLKFLSSLDIHDHE